MPRKPKQTQAINIGAPQGRDLFQTPNYAVDLLVPFIPDRVTTIWECAAGEGKIANRLRQYNFAVYPSDIRATETVNYFNFLSSGAYPPIMAVHPPLAIITNPPFSAKRQFFEKCLEYDYPFALLIPADYCGWTIDAVDHYGCEKIIPNRRIDYITPTGKSGESGHTSYFHSLWLTRGFKLGKSETFVELTNEQKKEI